MICRDINPSWDWTAQDVCEVPSTVPGLAPAPELQPSFRPGPAPWWQGDQTWLPDPPEPPSPHLEHLLPGLPGSGAPKASPWRELLVFLGCVITRGMTRRGSRCSESQILHGFQPQAWQLRHSQVPGPSSFPPSLRGPGRGRRRASRYLRACRAFLPPRPGAMGLMPAARAFSGCRACPRPPCRLPACCASAAPGRRPARPGMRASAGSVGAGSAPAPGGAGSLRGRGGRGGRAGSPRDPEPSRAARGKPPRPRLGACSPVASRLQSGAGRAQGLRRTPCPAAQTRDPDPAGRRPGPRPRAQGSPTFAPGRRAWSRPPPLGLALAGPPR